MTETRTVKTDVIIHATQNIVAGLLPAAPIWPATMLKAPLLAQRTQDSGGLTFMERIPVTLKPN